MPPDWPPFPDDDLTDQAASRLVDLIYALGDFVADHYAARLRRHDQRQRDEAFGCQPTRDPRQLELFGFDALDPF
jgi:hypothetical protein